MQRCYNTNGAFLFLECTLNHNSTGANDGFLLYTTLEDTPDGLTILVPTNDDGTPVLKVAFVYSNLLPHNEFRVTDGHKLLRIVVVPPESKTDDKAI